MATYVTMSRNVSQCARFYSRELPSSPLALLQRLVRYYPFIMSFSIRSYRKHFSTGGAPVFKNVLYFSTSEKKKTKETVDVCFQDQPMSQLMKNTQTCDYQFDNKGKHLVAALCTEEHVYVPFTHK